MNGVILSFLSAFIFTSINHIYVTYFILDYQDDKYKNSNYYMFLFALSFFVTYASLQIYELYNDKALISSYDSDLFNNMSIIKGGENSNMSKKLSDKIISINDISNKTIDKSMADRIGNYDIDLMR